MTGPDLNWRTLLSRGLHRKCPRCGEGALFLRWSKLRESCPACGLTYLENQGDLWAVLLFADRVLFMVPLVVVFFVGRGSESIWPYVFGVCLGVMLVVTFPHRLGLSVALDFRIRKSTGDLAG